jgi:hypothetical protein
MSFENGGNGIHNEFPQVFGYKVVAVRTPDELPANKDVLVLYTRDHDLLQRLKHWAYRTDSTILYNPDNADLSGVGNLFAMVADGGSIEGMEIPERISERVLPADLKYELIETILDDLKPSFERLYDPPRSVKGRFAGTG